MHLSLARELVAGVRDLVSLPEAYLQIQALLRDPDSTTGDFARAVQGDPGLAARVLRVANSAFFGVSRKVETISLAVNLMGISRLHDLVLATAVISTFDALPIRGMDMATFWRRSIHTGILGRMLAQQSGVFDSERLFVAGLLHDIGHLVMYLRRPAEAARALEESRGRGVELAHAERELLGFHYGEAGAELMRGWQFPDSLQQACGLHVEPWLAAEFGRECAVVNLARLAMFGADTDGASQPFVAAADPRALALTGLSGEALQRVAGESMPHLAETLEMLLARRAA